VVLALYPQYSCSTVAAVWDELARILATRRRIPGITFIRDYADNELYIQALASSARASFEKHGEPDLLLLSYHGIPQRFANEGDDYPQRCRDTTRELVSALGLPPEKVMMITRITKCLSTPLPAAHARPLQNTASRICCCFPITVSRSGLPMKVTIIRSAAAIPRVSWCPPWACRRRR